MEKARKNRVINTIALVCVIAIAIATSPAAPFASAAASSYSGVAVTGSGFMDTLACVACISGFLIGSGSTAGGLAVFLALNPELAALCFLACNKVT
jgi:hypothetical protein